MLAATVRMQEEASRGLASPIRQAQCLVDQLGLETMAHRPTDNPSAGQVHDSGQIEPAFRGGDIRDVGDSRLIHRPAIKASRQHVRSHRLAELGVSGNAVGLAIHGRRPSVGNGAQENSLRSAAAVSVFRSAEASLFSGNGYRSRPVTNRSPNQALSKANERIVDVSSSVLVP
jgi:hypothetical protein